MPGSDGSTAKRQSFEYLRSRPFYNTGSCSNLPVGTTMSPFGYREGYTDGLYRDTHRDGSRDVPGSRYGDRCGDRYRELTQTEGAAITGRKDHSFFKKNTRSRPLCAYQLLATTPPVATFYVAVRTRPPGTVFFSVFGLWLLVFFLVATRTVSKERPRRCSPQGASGRSLPASARDARRPSGGQHNPTGRRGNRTIVAAL